MITDNYAINNSIIDFLERQSIPNLSDEIYLELAPKFTSYQTPFFIYSQEKSITTPDFYDIKSDLEQIEFVEKSSLNLTDSQIKSKLEDFLNQHQKDFQQEISNLSLNWVYQINKDLTEIKIQVDKPEEDLTWSDSAFSNFVEYLEENLPKLDLDEVEQLSSEELQQYLNLSKLWKQFKPESRWYLYQWKRDPQNALQEILDAIQNYQDKLNSDSIALEIYEFYSEN